MSDLPGVIEICSGTTRFFMIVDWRDSSFTNKSKSLRARPGRSINSPFPFPNGTRIGEAVVPGSEDTRGISG